MDNSYCRVVCEPIKTAIDNYNHVDHGTDDARGKEIMLREDDGGDNVLKDPGDLSKMQENVGFKSEGDAIKFTTEVHESGLSHPLSTGDAADKPGKTHREMPLMLAVRIIQRAWRKHIDVQVYQYYRDLINFQQKGDPAKILRCINPIESKLLDAAAGVYVKFRLAGPIFPPNIYYKIFTQRPVQDLCANSPKDYTVRKEKRQIARAVHNKSNGLTESNDRDGWYKRYENNGWRLVSEKSLQTFKMDSTNCDSNTKMATFHHSRLQRIQDVAARKKKKKLLWMQKMYQQGLMRARQVDAETADLIDAATAGMLATVDVLGADAIHEWEVDELLDWTTALNYDDYLLDWRELATSASSNAHLAEDSEEKRNDAPELSFPLSRSFTDVTNRMSHNTPVSNQSLTSLKT